MGLVLLSEIRLSSDSVLVSWLLPAGFLLVSSESASFGFLFQRGLRVLTVNLGSGGPFIVRMHPDGIIVGSVRCSGVPTLVDVRTGVLLLDFKLNYSGSSLSGSLDLIFDCNGYVFYNCLGVGVEVWDLRSVSLLSVCWLDHPIWGSESLSVGSFVVTGILLNLSFCCRSITRVKLVKYKFSCRRLVYSRSNGRLILYCDNSLITVYRLNMPE